MIEAHQDGISGPICAYAEQVSKLVQGISLRVTRNGKTTPGVGIDHIAGAITCDEHLVAGGIEENNSSAIQPISEAEAIAEAAKAINKPTKPILAIVDKDLAIIIRDFDLIS